MNAAGILEGIQKLKALVIGDVCLDRWCRYDPAAAEPSRETGIDRIGVTATDTTPGAAGTVANNLVALGARQVAVLGVVGEDGFGFELVRDLKLREISTELLVHTPLMPTFTYTKLINGVTEVEDLPRVDYVYTRDIPAAVEQRLLNNLQSCWNGFDVVLISDQAETQIGGVITGAVRGLIAELAAAAPDKVVWVDSRVRGERFRNVLLKCNAAEADGACRRAFGSLNLSRLRTMIGAKPLVITRGSEGAMVVEENGEHVVAGWPIEKPIDICGAGDSFSAGAAMALAITGSNVDAVRFGNLISSITIMKAGTGTATPSEVLAAEREHAQ